MRAIKASTSRRVTCVKCEQGQLDVLLRHPPRSISGRSAAFHAKQNRCFRPKQQVAYSDSPAASRASFLDLKPRTARMTLPSRNS